PRQNPAAKKVTSQTAPNAAADPGVSAEKSRPRVDNAAPAKHLSPENLSPQTPPPADTAPTPPEAAPVAGEMTYTSCFRIRMGYKPVGLAEAVAVLLPPALLLGGMGAISLMELAGASAGFNIFAHWPWSTSAIAAAVAWLLLVPLGL